MSADSAPPNTPLMDTAPTDRLCDLVMKGGITSGVVYPLAILELAKSYRFKNIGGTSAGAIAAVVTAAAEYQRRRGSMAGFEKLGALPKDLGEPVGSQSRLLSLFQPSPSTKRLFTALIYALNRKSTTKRWLGAALGFLRAYWWPAIIGFVIALGISWLLGSQGALGVAVLAVIGIVAGVLGGTYHDIVKGLVPNGFGLCKCGPGLGSEPALVPWLHILIQTTAGRGANEPPLTFKDLWEAPGFPPDWLKTTTTASVHSINLQVFTTNLTHGRPYHLPLEDDTSRLFFKAQELKAYFPDDVIAHMVAHAKPYQSDLLEMPCAELPIVVAARLSLSFPILISAVPLWAIDEHPDPAKTKPRKCWFSDGGICSNFPIHLFDGLIPKWPTFGITLEARTGASKEEPVWLPPRHVDGRADAWNNFADKPDAIGRLGGFLASIVSTAQSWNDATGTRMPGVRDRVVHVRLLDGEGGLNLNMPPDRIKSLAGYGTKAGRELLAKFAPAEGRTESTVGWREHRWVRFNVALFALRDRLNSLGVAADLANHAMPLRDQIRAGVAAKPLEGDDEPRLTQQQATALEQLLDALKAAENAFARAAEPQTYKPTPQPAIRVRSPL